MRHADWKETSLDGDTGTPCSPDLRKRVVAAINGGMSRHQATKPLGVAISEETVGGWKNFPKKYTTRLSFKPE
jgi:transposase